MSLAAVWRALEDGPRRRILSYARGSVLEISVGTGVNFNYYPLHVKVTATDISARMVEKARSKAIEKGINAEFIVSSTEELDLPLHSFDTIVSTFSIGEYGNPISVLNQFNDWCKPGGAILLLEQGLSNYMLLKLFQKMLAPHHYKRTGRHIDFDFKAVIDNSLLTIQTLERKFGGMLYIVLATTSEMPRG